MQNVLVLDGQTTPALACVRSLGRADYGVFVASTSGSPLAAWSRYCRGHFRIPSETLDGFAALRSWAQNQGVHVALPMSEISCWLCDLGRSQWEQVGIVVGCAPREVLARAFDKWAAIQTAMQCGIAVPATQFPNSLEESRRAAEDVGFPCVVKPRFSHAWSGSQFLPNLGTSYCQAPSEVESAVLSRKQAEHWPLIQAFVSGRGKGVFALRAAGRVVAWFAHERLREMHPEGSGSTLRRSIALDPCLRQQTERFLERVDWTGPAMIEFKSDGTNAPWFMEINGRFWNSLQLAIDAGVDFPLLWMRVLEGEAVDPLSEYETGVVLRYLWGDVRRFIRILGGPRRGYSGPFPSVWQGAKELFGRQPRGTRLEILRMNDPWPAFGEWAQRIHRRLPVSPSKANAHCGDGKPGSRSHAA